jgi:hypothetical protein
MPSQEQPQLNEPTPANLPQQKSVNSLIDELLREQEIEMEDVDDLLQDDARSAPAPAPAPVAPSQQPSARNSSAGDNWW